MFNPPIPFDLDGLIQRFQENLIKIQLPKMIRIWEYNFLPYINEHEDIEFIIDPTHSIMNPYEVPEFFEGLRTRFDGDNIVSDFFFYADEAYEQGFDRIIITSLVLDDDFGYGMSVVYEKDF